MAANLSVTTYQVGQPVYFIEDNAPKRDIVKEVKSVLEDTNNDDSGEQSNVYLLEARGTKEFTSSQLASSKANLITAFTNAANALA